MLPAHEEILSIQLVTNNKYARQVRSCAAGLSHKVAARGSNWSKTVIGQKHIFVNYTPFNHDPAYLRQIYNSFIIQSESWRQENTKNHFNSTFNFSHVMYRLLLKFNYIQNIKYVYKYVKV
jgi:hypothetical protein